MQCKPIVVIALKIHYILRKAKAKLATLITKPIKNMLNTGQTLGTFTDPITGIVKATNITPIMITKGPDL